jgi:hypothetical protein
MRARAAEVLDGIHCRRFPNIIRSSLEPKPQTAIVISATDPKYCSIFLGRWSYVLIVRFLITG